MALECQFVGLGMEVTMHCHKAVVGHVERQPVTTKQTIVRSGMLDVEQFSRGIADRHQTANPLGYRGRHRAADPSRNTSDNS